MHKNLYRVLFILSFFLCPMVLRAQTGEHLEAVKQRLDNLSSTLPGLKQKVQLNLSNVSLQEYLNALGRTTNLSITLDSKLNFKISQSFNDVTAENILLFLAKEYNLNIDAVGSIIMISPYQDPRSLIKPAAKEIKVKYNQLENTLSFELSNDSLTAVARQITSLSNKNVIVPVALQGKRVSGYMAVAPFETALDKLAFTNELKLVKTNDNYFLFQPLGEGEELVVNGDRNTTVRRNFRPVNSGPSNGNIGLTSRMVNGRKLISADAVNAPIADLVKQASQEMVKSYFLYTELKGNISTHITDITYEDFLTALFQGTEFTYNQQNGIYLIGDRKLEGLRVTRAIQLQNRPIDTVLTMIPAEWKRGIEIKEFREQNTILLSGSRPQINEIENFVKQIDLLVPMVLIEVTLLDVHKTRTVSTGIKAGVSDSVKTGGTLLPGLDYTFGARSINDFLTRVGRATSTNLGKVTPNFYVTLNALENNDNVDIRSVPKLSTLNGHSATLSIGTKRYYQIRNQNVIPSLSSPTSIFTNEYKEVEANLAIGIKPVVSGDDQVTLNISVNISDFIGIPPDNAPPPTSNSKFQSIIRVHNEDMVVLGGIERTESSENASGVPLLSRIPILKWLFSSRSKTNQKVVTVVFIKPTIIR